MGAALLLLPWALPSRAQGPSGSGDALVYLPFSTPASDHYGGQRPGDNLFGDTLVCLDARTGRRVWHYQSTLQVHDKVSGRLLAEVPLPAPASGAPMTYMTGGKQYVALPVGGESHPEELLALP